MASTSTGREANPDMTFEGMHTAYVKSDDEMIEIRKDAIKKQKNLISGSLIFEVTLHENNKFSVKIPAVLETVKKEAYLTIDQVRNLSTDEFSNIICDKLSNLDELIRASRLRPITSLD